MSPKDILLQLVTYPEPVPEAVIGWAARFAALLEAHLSVAIFEVDIQPPSNPLANVLLDLPALAAAERERSAIQARRYRTAVDGVGTAFTPVEVRHRTCAAWETPGLTAAEARLHDLTLVPLLPPPSVQTEVAERVAFSSGGPALVLPHGWAVAGASLDRVAVAWDFTAPAARALSHALPLLQRAAQVDLLIVTGEKPIPALASADRVLHRLERHGVRARLHQEDACGRPIGEAISGFATDRGLDLLVMGAFGHSRFREFVLGGATRSLLESPPCPVLLAH